MKYEKTSAKHKQVTLRYVHELDCKPITLRPTVMHNELRSFFVASMSEAFEDARSEVDSQMKSPTTYDSLEKIQVIEKSASKDLLNDDDLQLPPLETFFGEFTGLDLNPDCVSLAAELENDLLPSTPLTEDQLRHADSSLITGVPINQLNEHEGDEYWDLKGMMMNAAEQAEEFAIGMFNQTLRISFVLYLLYSKIFFSYLAQASKLESYTFLSFTAVVTRQ